MFGLVKKSSRPSLFLAVTEAGRALTELGINYPYQSLSKCDQAVADGHPVMILPGFMTTKASTKMLREYVAKLGYPVYDWGMGRNYGKMEYMASLVERLVKIQEKHGKQHLWWINRNKYKYQHDNNYRDKRNLALKVEFFKAVIADIADHQNTRQ